MSEENVSDSVLLKAYTQETGHRVEPCDKENLLGFLRIGASAATASKQREMDALRQQVLELSAQAGVMREALQWAAPYVARIRDIEIVKEALAIEPSGALLDHDNEVAAKALEDAANSFADESSWWIVKKLNQMAAERRNRK